MQSCLLPHHHMASQNVRDRRCIWQKSQITRCPCKELQAAYSLTGRPAPTRPVSEAPVAHPLRLFGARPRMTRGPEERRCSQCNNSSAVLLNAQCPGPNKSAQFSQAALGALEFSSKRLVGDLANRFDTSRKRASETLTQAVHDPFQVAEKRRNRPHLSRGQPNLSP